MTEKPTRHGLATGATTGVPSAVPADGAPRLLSGGNPHIAKSEGDAPVQACIDAMPGWKSGVGRRLDDIISAALPGVRKAVRWNSPLYGAGEDGWFLGVHCLTKYVKVAFFHGAALDPLPPVASSQPGVRYWHVHEGDAIDAAQLTEWVYQASSLPGEKM